jgi:hypothetical protein
MQAKTIQWMSGFLLLGGALSSTAKADDGFFGSNPLGFYIGAGVGRSTISQVAFDQYSAGTRDLDGHPLGWNAVVGLRPIPFAGVEAEFIDFGRARQSAGPILNYGGGETQQYLGGDVTNRAAALFAVGYLPLPLPFLEPFAKVGYAWDWEHDSYSGVYDSTFYASSNGAQPVGLASGSNSGHPSGVAYGGGLQFRYEHLAIRAEYVRISLDSTSFIGGPQRNNPALLSIGLNWTF